MKGCWVRVAVAEQEVSYRSQPYLSGATRGGSREVSWKNFDQPYLLNQRAKETSVCSGWQLA